MLKPLRTTRQEITRGLCLICVEEMTSKLSNVCQQQQRPAGGNKPRIIVLLSPACRVATFPSLLFLSSAAFINRKQGLCHLVKTFEVQCNKKKRI